MIPVFYPTYFSEYELIDSGNFEKLERFGQFVLARPEPQAIWPKSFPQVEWENMADAYFYLKKLNAKVDNFDRGEWKLKNSMSEKWHIQYQYRNMHLIFRLALTSFKHVGIFPEQAENWNFIYDTVKFSSIKEFRVLNLFAYTGGASLAACAAGAKVTHVDSVKQVISWANENMQSSALTSIRWIAEDVFKFVRREVNRGNRYHGIILDPPAYGRGPKGEKWLLDHHLAELLFLCNKLLIKEKNAFMLLNLYSMGYSPLIAKNLLLSEVKIDNIEIGELAVKDKSLRILPLGVFSRFVF